MNISRATGLSLIAVMTLSIAAPARAQDEGVASGSILLLSQTPWTTAQDTTLRLAVRIRNEGNDPITDPQIVWAIGPKMLSRVQYESALAEGPAFVASADTIPLPSDLAPGESADVPIRIEVSEVGGIDGEDSGVYPLHLELRSGLEQLADLTTAAIHLVRQPEQPVRFSWWTEIASPVAFGPDGTLIDQGFEASLEDEGGLAAQVEAIAGLLADTTPVSAVDLIVSPAALDQLRQAADGYERTTGGAVPGDARAPRVASDTLRLLRDIASDPAVEIHAMPFAAPRLPALLASGLRTHLDMQWQLGDETVERILGRRPDPRVARPPGLAFDQVSVDALAARGVTTILGGADSVERPPQPSGFAPPPAATLRTTSSKDVALALPDPGTQALLADTELLRDPVRASQAVLGELAIIWKEQPVPPEGIVRGLALDLAPDLPAKIWGPLIRRLAGAPFLRGVHAEDLVDGIQPAPGRSTLRASRPEAYSGSYAQDLFATARDVAAFAAMLQGPGDEAQRLRRAVFYAEASQYIGKEGSGRMWIDAVNRVTDRTFAALAPDTSRLLTFTSRSGNIPLRMGDPGDRVVKVEVQLASGRVEFLDGSSRSVLVDHANQVITFLVEVKASGRSPIDVLVRSPNGFVLARKVLVVRSTAVNPIALIITAGAGLILVGLWSRRLFRRRST